MTFFKKLCITYADPNNLQDEICVDYNLRSTPITHKWVEKVQAAQKLNYPIDDPGRFYGFGSIQQQRIDALEKINSVISQLQKHIQIDYLVKSVDDQDTLNRLHHIFEIEHGLLDSKHVDFEFKQNLCNLNLSIHRCESVARGAYPRHVVTYFGLPKTAILESEDFQYFDPAIKFGTVYINYVEIGKTLFDLMLDNDSYIDPTAFQPFRHYSADFVVKFWNDDNVDLPLKLENYYQNNRNYFANLGYTWDCLKQSIGSIPVADLDHDANILVDLQSRQFVKAVHFS